MSERFINMDLTNIESEHLCCAIADKKRGVNAKKEWLKERIPEGHIFRKLDERGKVLIEYAPLETAWVPVKGDNYIYIYCFWVSGSFKGKGYAKSLLEYCIDDAKKQGKSGICVLSSKKKKPFLTEKSFMVKYGFEVADVAGEYELLALSFDGSRPAFAEGVKQGKIESNNLTIFYDMQCPYITGCVEQIRSYCESSNSPLELVEVDSLEKAKALPCVFNNWAVFYNGEFKTVQLMDKNGVKKLLGL